MKKFQIIDEFKGYVSKKDITNLDPYFLVSPSKNVFINDGEKVSIRPGYELYGAANTTATPIEFGETWNTSTGTEIPLRAYDDELEFYYSGSWRKLKDGWSDVDFQMTTWWDATEQIDKTLFVNGDSNIYSWSGAITTIASATSNTITKNGTTTWAEARFLTTGTRKVVINGTEYTYTGGESTTTLTGVTPSPAAEAADSVAHQAMITTANTPSATFNNEIIGVLNNQIYLGDTTKRQVYISDDADFTDYTPATPRIPGDGVSITPDSPPKAFVAQEEEMYVSCGKDEWYRIEFKLSADLVNETVEIKKLKTSPLQGAVSANAVAKIKNDVVFISNEPTIDSLGRIENVDEIRTVALSDSIKTDMDGYDLTNGGFVFYYKNQIFVSIPSSSKVLVYDLERSYWQPPWDLAISSFATVDGDLIGHSALVAESYKLLTGTSDNSKPINAVAAFAYYNADDRANLKNMNEYYSEGYIKSNTTLDLTLKFDFGGYTSLIEKEIDGTDSDLIYQTSADGSLGKNPLGSNPLGSVTDSISDLPKFRIFHELKRQDYYEMQAVYGSNEIDYQWELLAHGGNVGPSTNGSNDLKR